MSLSGWLSKMYSRIFDKQDVGSISTRNRNSNSTTFNTSTKKRKQETIVLDHDHDEMETVVDVDEHVNRKKRKAHTTTTITYPFGLTWRQVERVCFILSCNYRNRLINYCIVSTTTGRLCGNIS